MEQVSDHHSVRPSQQSGCAFGRREDEEMADGREGRIDELKSQKRGASEA